MFRTYALLKDHFLNRMQLLYTDTDSFIIKLDGDDIYKEIKDTPAVHEIFDLSNVPVDHPSGLHDPDDPNASRLGYFKSETKMNPIIEVVALRPKMYSFTVRPSPISLFWRWSISNRF